TISSRFESATRRRCRRGARHLRKGGERHSARAREGTAGFFSRGGSACQIGCGLCRFGRSGFCYRRRTKSYGHASHFQRPIGGPQRRGEHGEHLRSTRGCRSRDSHSQTATANTAWPCDYSGAAATRSGLGSNPQRSSLSRVGGGKETVNAKELSVS